MTQGNIINEAVEYIPHKTKDERPAVVRVPLNGRAKELIEKYKGIDTKGVYSRSLVLKGIMTT